MFSRFAVQVDRSGKAVKLDKDGFPDISTLGLDDDQDRLRLEAYQAMAQAQARLGPIGDDGFPMQSEITLSGWAQESQQQPGGSRTPFASYRPQANEGCVCCCC